MAEELGKIEKPEAEKFSRGRKLLFVPLIFSSPEPDEELGERLRKYWDEVEYHVANLEQKLGSIKKVFHELVPVGGEEADKVIEELNSASCRIVRSRVEKGAEILPLEDVDMLTEFMDWSRCLAIGLQNQKVFTRVYEAYMEAHSGRNESIAKKIGEMLNEDDIGILLMREGHQVQFPADIEVFYVAPPALDELKRWLRSREVKYTTEEQATGEEKVEGKSPGDKSEPVEEEQTEGKQREGEPPEGKV